MGMFNKTLFATTAWAQIFPGGCYLPPSSLLRLSVVWLTTPKLIHNFFSLKSLCSNNVWGIYLLIRSVCISCTEVCQVLYLVPEVVPTNSPKMGNRDSLFHLLGFQGSDVDLITSGEKDASCPWQRVPKHLFKLTSTMVFLCFSSHPPSCFFPGTGRSYQPSAFLLSQLFS